ETKASGALTPPLSSAANDPPPAAQPDISATASAATLSSWRTKGPLERKIPRPAFAAVAAMGLLVIGVLVIALASGSSGHGPSSASSALDPSVPDPVSVEPPVVS